MATCPECDAEIEVDEFDVDKGDLISCPDCGSNLEVTSIAPVELELADDEDDDEDDDDEDDEDDDEDDDDDVDEDDDDDGERGLGRVTHAAPAGALRPPPAPLTSHAKPRPSTRALARSRRR